MEKLMEQSDLQLAILNRNLENIGYELMVAKRRVEYIKKCRETIWRDGFDKALEEATGEITRLEAMRSSMLEYYEKFINPEIDFTFTSSKELLFFGVVLSIEKNVSSESGGPCFKTEKELELEYRDARKKVDHLKKSGEYLSHEIAYIETLLFYAFNTFNKYIKDSSYVSKRNGINNREMKKVLPDS